MAKDHLLQIVKSLSNEEKKVIDKQIKNTYKSKQPYFLVLYYWYEKLLSKGFTNEQIEIELQKFLIRNPKMKKNIDNVRLELKERLQTIMLQCLPLIANENNVYQNVKIVEIFIQRKLYAVAQQLITKTKKKAKELDLNKYLVELTDNELFLLGKQSEKKDVDKQSNLIEAINQYQLLYTLELQLKNTYRQLILIVQKDVLLKQKENREVFTAIYQHHNLEELPIETYINAQHTYVVTWYYRIQNLYYRTTKQLDKAFINSQKLISYFETNSTIMKNFGTIYLKSICGFTRTCFMCNEHQALETSLEKIRELYKVNSDYNTLNITCDIGIIHYINTFQYDKAKELANFMEKEWHIISGKSVDGQLLFYCMNNILLFWVLGNNIKFKYWLTEGLNIARSNKGKQYYFAIRLFELIYDFEENHWEDFLKKIEALQRTLQNNQNLNDFEKTVLNHFKKLYTIKFSSKTFSYREEKKDELQKEALRSLKFSLKKLEFKSPPINYEEVMLWCESHLQNQPLKAVFETQV